VEFLGMRLILLPHVFDPRYAVSTSILVKAVRRWIARGSRPRKVLEIGCGSGAVSIAVAREAGCKVVGYDVSTSAVEAARLSARINGVENRTLFTADWSEVVREGPYDLIALNPPYLPLDPIDDLDTLWCCGSDYRTLREMFARAREASKSSTVVFTTCSSLTPATVCIEMLRALGFDPRPALYADTPLDRIWVFRASRTQP